VTHQPVKFGIDDTVTHGARTREDARSFIVLIVRNYLLSWENAVALFYKYNDVMYRSSIVRSATRQPNDQEVVVDL
jgi:hypothetical protein